MIRTLSGSNGMFEPEQVQDAIRPVSLYAPKSALLCVEQTTNLGGGAIWPVEKLDAVAAVAREAGLATHMDGARLMNAAVKSGVAPSRFAQAYDSVWIDFTKGLVAPLGAVLAGSHEFIMQAWRLTMVEKR